MARATADIIDQMDTEQATHTTLAGLTSPSQTAEYTLWKETIAVVLHEQEILWDTKRDEINAIVSAAAVGSAAWIQAKVLAFQYSATNPQILQLINFAPNYPVINTSLMIVTRCSVTTDLNKVVQIKVAKGSTPSPLAVAEYNSLVGYLRSILFAGVDFALTSIASDKLYVNAEVFYDGQYTAAIQTNVETAINAYLAAIPFDGKVKVSALQDAIQAVPGVTDVKLNTVKARQDAVVLGSASTIYDVVTAGVNVMEWNTVAGYIVSETTAGNTLADTITYTVAS